jgi:hypothetical protein
VQVDLQPSESDRVAEALRAEIASMEPIVDMIANPATPPFVVACIDPYCTVSSTVILLIEPN